jgi:hypothetical protein
MVDVAKLFLRIIKKNCSEESQEGKKKKKKKKKKGEKWSEHHCYSPYRALLTVKGRITVCVPSKNCGCKKKRRQPLKKAMNSGN